MENFRSEKDNEVIRMEKKPFQVGLIRVLTSDDQHFVDMHGQIIMDHFPGIQVESRCIPDQWEGIHSHELELIAVPKIVELAKTFQDKDMIIVSCADDPGVAEIREALPHMSVTGGGETTVALAGKYGEKIGLLGITDYAPRAYRKLPKDRLVAVEKPEGVNSFLMRTAHWKQNYKQQKIPARKGLRTD